jgi:hypothetical protein
MACQLITNFWTCFNAMSDDARLHLKESSPEAEILNVLVTTLDNEVRQVSAAKSKVG